MFKSKGWLSLRQKALHSRSPLPASDESQQLEDALNASLYIMDDDLDTAESRLSAGSSQFHKLALGLVTFIKASLGLEPEIMRDASNKLSSVESSASELQKYAEKHLREHESSSYPPGTYYAICVVQSQLLQALLALMNESLTEGIKGFYNLRKAYILLDNIIAHEQKTKTSRNAISSEEYMDKSTHSLPLNGSAGSRFLTAKLRTSSSENDFQRMTKTIKNSEPKQQKQAEEDESDGDDFFDADEYVENGASKVGRSNDKTKGVNGNTQRNHSPQPMYSAQHNQEKKQNLSTVDSFISSSSNMAFGIMKLVVSLVPPAFATLLKIVGFQGDRERGLESLWKATDEHNIYGAFSGIVIFAYYNFIIGSSDIRPVSDPSVGENLNGLLVDMRTRHPKSLLWVLEESRMIAGNRKLEEARQLLSSGSESPLKQVEALRQFELCLYEMFLHNYRVVSKSFQKLCDSNKWSLALYYYIAACAEVELYRKLLESDKGQAEIHAANATSLFDNVIAHAGKRRFLTRQLPFEVFVARKINKWLSRSQQWGVRMVDAIGVSPFEEMVYFWNGYRRMRREHLEQSLSILAWTDDASRHPNWHRESIDERAALALLRSVVFRHLGNTSQAKALIGEHVLCHDWVSYKVPLHDNWVGPVAHYELAVNLWRERDGSPEDAARLREAAALLERVSRWEKFDLNARFGIKITTAKDTLKNMEGVQGL